MRQNTQIYTLFQNGRHDFIDILWEILVTKAEMK